MKNIGLIIFLVFISQKAFSSSQSGIIVELRVSNINPTHFRLDGIWSGKPSCAITWWAIDSNTAGGKSLLSILLTAHSTGKTITVWGTDLCDLRSDMETAYQVGM